MDSRIYVAHLMSQYVQDRIEQTDAGRMGRAARPSGARLPRLAWRHTPRRRTTARYGTR